MWLTARFSCFMYDYASLPYLSLQFTVSLSPEGRMVGRKSNKHTPLYLVPVCVWHCDEDTVELYVSPSLYGGLLNK